MYRSFIRYTLFSFEHGLYDGRLESRLLYIMHAAKILREIHLPLFAPIVIHGVLRRHLFL